ncbi:MAG: DmsE family decaheme c-type cytochrome, partial [Deltaproteobacteria bacterium]
MKLLQRSLVCGLFIGVLCLATQARAADSDAQASTKQALAKDAVCTACHNEGWRVPVLAIYQTPHGNRADPRAPTCQSCHGESGARVKVPASARPDTVFGVKSKNSSPVDERNGACLACHQSGLRMHWSGSEHQTRNLSCSNCHTVHVAHDPVLDKVMQPDVCEACHSTQRAQTHRISTHPIVAGKMACSDCHNPHGSTGPKLLVKNSVNETCYTCHAEKRGPFLWEHAPVVDDCTNC